MPRDEEPAREQNESVSEDRASSDRVVEQRELGRVRASEELGGGQSLPRTGQSSQRSRVWRKILLQGNCHQGRPLETHQREMEGEEKKLSERTTISDLPLLFLISCPLVYSVLLFMF